MIVRLESTTKIVTLNGVEARTWEGHTETGIPVTAYITRIQVEADADLEQFQRELRECRAPTPDGIPLRLIL
jgi:hypothetical protein